MTPADASALLRRLATNRDTFTEWVISRAETQAIIDLVRDKEFDGAINTWNTVLDLIAAGTPVDGLRVIARNNRQGLLAGRARAQEATPAKHQSIFGECECDACAPDDGYLHTTLHGVKVKVLLDDGPGGAPREGA